MSSIHVPWLMRAAVASLVLEVRPLKSLSFLALLHAFPRQPTGHCLVPVLREAGLGCGSRTPEALF